MTHAGSAPSMDGTEGGNAPDAPAGHPVVSGAPTPQELAAIIAVIEAQAREIEADAAHPALAHRTAWDWNRVAPRPALSPGTGSWRGFGADGL